MKTAIINGQLVEVIDYSPRPHQRTLDQVIDRWATKKEGPQFFVPVWHRRAGKSSSLVNILIKQATNPDRIGQYYYLYPVQKKLREHIWDNPQILPKFLPMSQVAKKDDQRMVITFRNGSQIIFDGTDEDPHKHRGANGAGWVVDEYDDQQAVIFDEIIRPIVRFNKGWVVLCGTPRGVKHLHEAYKAGQDPLRTQWWSELLPATESYDSDGKRLLTDEELADERQDMTAKGIGDSFEQEYLCKFVQGQAQVFRKLEQVVEDDHGALLKPEEPDSRRSYRIGCDPAITNDYWVNSVIDETRNKEVCLERFQPHDTALGESRTEALARKYNNALLVVDESGLGRPISDHLRDKGLNVLPLPTGTVKERLITNLSLQVDSLTYRFLPDPVAMAEMRDFTFARLPSGRYQFQAPDGKHDDTVIARALGVYNAPQLSDPDSYKSTWDPFRTDQPTTNTHYGRHPRRTRV